MGDLRDEDLDDPFDSSHIVLTPMGEVGGGLALLFAALNAFG